MKEKQRKRRKRWLSLILVLVISFGILPGSSYLGNMNVVQAASDEDSTIMKQEAAIADTTVDLTFKWPASVMNVVREVDYKGEHQRDASLNDFKTSASVNGDSSLSPGENLIVGDGEGIVAYALGYKMTGIRNTKTGEVIRVGEQLVVPDEPATYEFVMEPATVDVEVTLNAPDLPTTEYVDVSIQIYQMISRYGTFKQSTEYVEQIAKMKNGETRTFQVPYGGKFYSVMGRCSGYETASEYIGTAAQYNGYHLTTSQNVTLDLQKGNEQRLTIVKDVKGTDDKSEKFQFKYTMSGVYGIATASIKDEDVKKVLAERKTSGQFADSTLKNTLYEYGLPQNAIVESFKAFGVYEKQFSYDDATKEINFAAIDESYAADNPLRSTSLYTTTFFIRYKLPSSEQVVANPELKAGEKASYIIIPGNQYTVEELNDDTDNYKLTQITGDATGTMAEGEEETVVTFTNTKKWKVSYDLDGGVGTIPEPETVVFNEKSTKKVPEIPKKEGYTFKGWQDAAGNLYQPGDYVTVDQKNDIEIKAVWEKNNYTLTYTGEADKGMPEPLSAEISFEDKIVVAAAPERTGHTFLGWEAEDGTVYQPGEEFNMPAKEVILTAKWKVKEFTLTYHVEGDLKAGYPEFVSVTPKVEANNAPATETVKYGENIKLPQLFTSQTVSATNIKENGVWSFEGWYKDAGYTQLVDKEVTIGDSNMELYGKWKFTAKKVGNTVSDEKPRDDKTNVNNTKRVNKNGKGTVKTGDNTMLPEYIGLALFALGGIIFILTRRKENTR